MVHRNKKDYRRGAVTRAALTELEDVRVINIISNPQQHKTLHERTGESVIATDHRVSDLSVQGVVSGCDESIARKTSNSNDSDQF